MPWNKTDETFKTLINRRTTDSNGKFYYNEVGDFTIDTHAKEIKLGVIPADPSVTSDPNYGNIQAYTLEPLVWNQSVPNYQAWFASTNQVTFSSQNDQASRLNNWISPKYDGRDSSLNYVGTTASYKILLYTKQSGGSTWNQVADSDICDWFFNYQTGDLVMNGTSTAYGSINSSTLFAVTGYRYVGTRGVSNGTITSIGGINGVKTDQSGGAAISTTGNLELDLAYSPTWTGTHTFSKQLDLTSIGGSSGAHLLLSSTLGMAPSSLSDGELWYDGSGLNFRYGSSTVNLLNTLSLGSTIGNLSGAYNGFLYVNSTGHLAETSSVFSWDGTNSVIDLNCNVQVSSSGGFVFDNSSYTTSYPTPQNGITWLTSTDSASLFLYQHAADSSDFWIQGGDNDHGDRIIFGVKESRGVYANKETVSIMHTNFGAPIAGIQLNSVVIHQGSVNLNAPALAYQYVSTSATTMSYVSIIRNNGANYNGPNGSTLTITVDVSSYTLDDDTLILILIDGTSSPNTFSWGTSLACTATTGFTQTGVAITGSAQTLGTTGVKVTFSGTTGGILNETFGFRVLPGGVLNVNNPSTNHLVRGNLGVGTSLTFGSPDVTTTLFVQSNTNEIGIKLNTSHTSTSALMSWQVDAFEVIGVSNIGNLYFSPRTGSYGLRVGNLAYASLPSAASGNSGAIVWDTTDTALLVSNGASWLQLATIGIGSTAVTGAGTTNTIPIWTGSETLGNSIITQSSGNIDVNGNFSAKTKSFKIPYPTDPKNYYLVYGVLEGPEHGVYHRGRFKTDANTAYICLPEYWEELVGDNYSVMLTPRGDYGVYCSANDCKGFEVSRMSGHSPRISGMEFDFYVVGGRKDAPLTIKQKV